MHKMARAFCPGMGRASSSRNEMALSSGRVPISSSGRGGGSSSRRGDSRPICHGEVQVSSNVLPFFF